MLSSIKGPFELNLLLLKTENWKHCSKIIFKCVKSTVKPIFNIFNTWTVLIQYINGITPVQGNFCLYTVNLLFMRKKKKKRRKREMKMWTLIPTETKRSLTHHFLKEIQAKNAANKILSNHNKPHFQFGLHGMPLQDFL